ncbi:MAG: acetyl-CoA carboxylase biotin carboxyl carrier protein [Pseudomonadales bacterium]|nr:acetyl-CoA carboxylase biotin carboxyl carrier protein [Pseudomonadales bacterium]MDG1444273.1 acetyl-CoA carboxylase biotin carboxyl carrier protein [Pseudomonadales bacterium]
MDIRKVKKLIELMEESDITEIEVKEGEDSVRISRMNNLSAQAAPVVQFSNSAAAEPSPLVSAPVVTDTASVPSGFIVAAPMVGTFYSAPSPGSPVFVDVGTRVNEGDTLCIIESMKMMNQIKAEKSGVIEAVLVGNETAVEYDQPLFTIV